jgi:hypothetical protein
MMVNFSQVLRAINGEVLQIPKPGRSKPRPFQPAVWATQWDQSAALKSEFEAEADYVAYRRNAPVTPELVDMTLGFICIEAILTPPPLERPAGASPADGLPQQDIKARWTLADRIEKAKGTLDLEKDEVKELKESVCRRFKDILIAGQALDMLERGEAAPERRKRA